MHRCLFILLHKQRTENEMSSKIFEKTDEEANKTASVNERSSLLDKTRTTRQEELGLGLGLGLGQPLTGQNQYYAANQILTVINDRRSRFQQNFSLVCLLAVNVLERFAYYGLLCNFLLYLNKQPLYWESYNASLVLFVFQGIANVSGLVGGWVADSLIGKYATICLSFVLYIMGYAVYPLLSVDSFALPGVCNANSSVVDWSVVNATTTMTTSRLTSDRSVFNEACSWIILPSTVLIGVGVGFVKSNLGPFGADQVIHSLEKKTIYFSIQFEISQMHSIILFKR